MTITLIVSNVLLWLLVPFLALLLWRTLRALGLLVWRFEQLEATTPRQLGRDGLRVGKKAPDFTLPSTTEGERSLHDFTGRKLLLVFTQSGCGPCTAIIPELNRLHEQREPQVLVVNNGDLESTRHWAAKAGACFGILAQKQFSISKRYQVFATPFAFLIDEKGIITSKGTISSRQHIGYVLSGAGNRLEQHLEEPERNGSVKSESVATLTLQEVGHA